MNKLEFQDVTLKVIDRNGAVWLTTQDIAQSLYGRKGVPRNEATFEKRIRNLYARHCDEFTNSMTSLIELKTNGGVQTVRVFSLRGAHLLGMLARTERAKEFRRWVLDVIEMHNNEIGILTTQYHKALVALETGQANASVCGKGLNKWKLEKTKIVERLARIKSKLQPDLFIAA